MLFEGKRVRLRAVEPTDVEVFVTNSADTDAARSGYRVVVPQSVAEAERWVEAQTTEGEEFRLVIEAEGEPVGTINTHTCDLRAGTFSYGVTVFGWQQRRGYASDAIVILLRYMFGERRYQKCTVTVADFNEPSLVLHRGLGFQDEGRIRRAGFGAGHHWDEIVVGITVEEFASRWGF